MKSDLEKRATVMLERLKNIPQSSSVLLADAPFAWFVYVKFTPTQKYYIVVDKKYE